MVIAFRRGERLYVDVVFIFGERKSPIFVLVFYVYVFFCEFFQLVLDYVDVLFEILHLILSLSN